MSVAIVVSRSASQAFLLPVSFLLHLQVSEELIRVAILWHEQWHEGLEEASRLYFGEQKILPMFEVLDPLHDIVQKGAQTLKETSFHQVRFCWSLVSCLCCMRFQLQALGHTHPRFGVTNSQH